ncbi:acyltransferase [Neiella sp. HB171785]|uniref:Acyltransferase n=1 Tax=Neiella litorisoli TaxID=2771431 RepID=A0A8J6QRN5_9GAMM|nr:acyltransferase family protein [Neiella litorisoli]MBD1390351.1 acyltransferase [Neiella litorisoli]
MKTNQFRLDINGLRGVAVIAVVLYHFNNEWLPSGFAGVDVFFVVSGFLMTKIIMTAIDNSSFSLIRFYQSRANRIIPALAFVCLAVLLYGWFQLLNGDFNSLLRHVYSSLLFFSNHVYWMESGYFEANAMEKWLLHTWSLSVEWQFYLAYPLVLLGLAKISSRRFIKAIVLTGAAVGFAFSIVATGISADAAYFLLPTRAWQLLLGAVAFFYPMSLGRYAKVISYGALLTIILSMFVFDESTPWPSYFAILPTLSAFFILQCNYKDNIVINNKALQVIGLWSYSIYLWHWPVAVYINNLNFSPSKQFYYLLTGIVASLVLGALSYYIIEQKRYMKAKYAIFALVACSSYMLLKAGVPQDLREMSSHPANQFIASYGNYSPRGGCLVSEFQRKHQSMGIFSDCLDMNSSGGVFMWGDSHMSSISLGLRQYIPKGITINRVFSSGCPSSFQIKRGSVSRLRRACDFSNELALKAIKKIRPETVIIANKDKHEMMDWANTVTTLKSLGVREIVLVGPLPQWYPSLPAVYAKHSYGKTHISGKKLDQNVVKTNEKMAQMISDLDSVTYIDVINRICPESEDQRTCHVTYGDELLAFDYGHLTLSGSKHIAKEIIVPILDVTKKG